MVLVAALSCREFAWITLERKTKRDDSGWDMIEQVERGSIGIHDTSEEEARVKTPGSPKDLGRSSVHGDWLIERFSGFEVAVHIVTPFAVISFLVTLLLFSFMPSWSSGRELAYFLHGVVIMWLICGSF